MPESGNIIAMSSVATILTSMTLTYAFGFFLGTKLKLARKIVEAGS